MTNTIDKIISELELKPHPEGGYFKETYRSFGEIKEENLGPHYNGKRNYSTCIYFLLTSDKFSALHRIKQDEIWHFYDGSPISLHTISESGIHAVNTIGRDVLNGETPQFVVPGFSFDDFELKSRKELTSLFPDKKDVISKLTHH